MKQTYSQKKKLAYCVLVLLVAFFTLSCSPKVKKEEAVPFEKQEHLIRTQTNRLAIFAWYQQTKLENEFQRRLAQNKGVMDDRLTQERDRVYFGVNRIFNQFFEDAMKAEPKNPANYVAYGFYLRPRRGKFEEALTYIQKGTELEPANALYHFLLAYAYVAPLKSGEYIRTSPTEKATLRRYFDKYTVEITRAKKLMPDNGFLDYFDALTTYYITEDSSKAFDLILEGNKKDKFYFLFPPPFPAVLDDWESTDAKGKFISLEWSFGYYPPELVQSLLDALLKKDEIRNNPEKLFELARFLYQMGITRPFDRVFHYLTWQILERLLVLYREKAEKEKVSQLTEVKRLYDDITVSLAKWYEKKIKGIFLVTEPKNFLEFEDKVRRNYEIMSDALNLHLRLLKQVRSIIGLNAEDYPLRNQMWERE